MRRLLLVGLVLLTGAGASLPASAQINPFYGSTAQPLNNDDMAALQQATDTLLNREQLIAGGVEPWSNPKSGLSGTATLGNAVNRKGMTCRIVEYAIISAKSRPTRNPTLTWCKTPNGWRIG